jgi:potassium-dependent mechanosensitive channel
VETSHLQKLLLGLTPSVVPASFLVLFFLSFFLIPQRCVAQTKKPTAAPPASQPSVEPPKPGPIVPLPQVVAQAEDITRLLTEIKARLDSDADLNQMDQEVAGLEEELGTRSRDLDEIITSQPTLSELGEREREWEMRREQYATWRKVLDERARRLEKDLARLDGENARGQATLKSIETDPTLAEVANRVRQQLGDLQSTRVDVIARANNIVLLQNRLSLLDQAAVEALRKIGETSRLTQRGIFERDSPPLWNAQSAGPKVISSPYHREWIRFGQFVSIRRRALYVLAVAFVVVLVIAIQLKRKLPRLLHRNLIPQGAAHFFKRPFSLALLVALLGTLLLGPNLPVIARDLIAVLFLIPVFRLLVPVMTPVVRPLPYAFAVFGLATAAIELSGVSRGTTTRIVSAALAVVALGTFGWMVRRSRLHFGEQAHRWSRFVLFVTRAGLLLLAVSVAANLFGYVALAVALKVGLILSCYLAVILYTAYHVANAAVPLILKTAPAASIASVRLYRQTVESWVSRLLALAAICLWFYASLNFFSIRKAVADAVGGTLTTPLRAGTINLSLRDLLIFFLTLFAGVTLARVVRTLLQEDVLPRFSLKRGVPNTISTLIYFGLVVTVFLVSAAAAGVEFSRFAIMGGAFGLGVGFGLQSVITNLASGLLLLLERPINVGDVMEVEGLSGVCKRIGLRSSTIRTAQGAEVIVPNNNLITNHVINWTLSERHRRVDIPIGVAYGSDPEQVIKLMIEVASSHPKVAPDPVPLALFIGFGDSALNFELRFWSPHAQTYQQLKSEVAIRLGAAFGKAGIRIPGASSKDLNASIQPASPATTQHSDGPANI